MKRVLRLLMIVIGVLSVSSCAIHSGYMNNSASLSQANFNYIKTSISGTASTIQVLGIGGLQRYAIVEEAKKDMLKNNPLKPNQALANITVNWKSNILLVVMINECTVTADVVEFYSGSKIDVVELKEESENIQTNSKNTDITNIQEGNNVYAPFKVGDKVLYKDDFRKFEGVIHKVEGGNYHLKYIDKRGNEKTRITTISWIKKIE